VTTDPACSDWYCLPSTWCGDAGIRGAHNLGCVMGSFVTHFVQGSEAFSSSLLLHWWKWIWSLHRSMTRVPGLHSSLHGEKVSCSWSRIFAILVRGDLSRLAWARLRFVSAKWSSIKLIFQGYMMLEDRKRVDCPIQRRTCTVPA